MAQTPPALYGTQKLGLPKRLGERLREMWDPHDYVRIMNIDDETFYWQSLNPTDERHEIDRGPTQITYRRSPRQYSIKPGNSMPLEGWNAYIAVEQLYKKVLARKENAKRGGRKEISYNWQDPAGWDVFLPRIFMGKEVPTFGGQPIAHPVADIERDSVPVMTATEAIANSNNTSQSVNDLAKELGIELS